METSQDQVVVAEVLVMLVVLTGLLVWRLEAVQDLTQVQVQVLVLI
jgi:hypothetical protein